MVGKEIIRECLKVQSKEQLNASSGQGFQAPAKSRALEAEFSAVSLLRLPGIPASGAPGEAHRRPEEHWWYPGGRTVCVPGMSAGDRGWGVCVGRQRQLLPPGKPDPGARLGSPGRLTFCFVSDL